MLEAIETFLRYTAIPADTFGRLTVGDPHLVWKMRKPGYEIDQDVGDRVLEFLRRYEDVKS